eukprot:6446804-Prymnesium_polylepis.1
MSMCAASAAVGGRARLEGEGGRLIGRALDDGRVLRDAARVDALLDVDVAIDAPVGVPRVADDPVALSGVVADGLDAVVERGAARAAEHARRVGLPLRRVDAHRDGALGDLREHLALGRRARRDGGVAADRDDGLRALVLARAGLLGGARAVRVRRLRLEAVALDVFVRRLRVAAVAAEVGLVARDDLLRRERVEMAGRHRHVRLDLLGRRERPAAAALPLVLDRRQDCRRVRAPVDRRRGRARRERQVELHLLRQQVGLRLVAHVRRAELLVREVGELVDKVEAQLAVRVARADLAQVLLEDLEARGVLLAGVRAAKVLLELVEPPRVLVGGVRDGGERGLAERHVDREEGDAGCDHDVVRSGRVGDRLDRDRQRRASERVVHAVAGGIEAGKGDLGGAVVRVALRLAVDRGGARQGQVQVGRVVDGHNGVDRLAEDGLGALVGAGRRGGGLD